MKTSETTTEIYGALEAFRAKAKKITNTKTAEEESRFWTFTPLPDLLAKIRPWLKAAGLIVIQDTAGDGRSAGVQTRLVHVESGEWIESSWLMLPSRDRNDAKGAVTEARRYSLTALLDIATFDDDSVRPSAPAPQAQPESSYAGTFTTADSAPATAGQNTPAVQPEKLRWRPEKIRRLAGKLGVEAPGIPTTIAEADALIAELQARIDAKGAERS